MKETARNRKPSKRETEPYPRVNTEHHIFRMPRIGTLAAKESRNKKKKKGELAAWPLSLQRKGISDWYPQSSPDLWDKLKRRIGVKGPRRGLEQSQKGGRKEKGQRSESRSRWDREKNVGSACGRMMRGRRPNPQHRREVQKRERTICKCKSWIQTRGTAS